MQALLVELIVAENKVVQAFTLDSDPQLVSVSKDRLIDFITALIKTGPGVRHFRVALTIVYMLNVELLECMRYRLSEQTKQDCLEALEKLKYSVNQATMLCQKNV